MITFRQQITPSQVKADKMKSSKGLNGH